MSEPPPFEPSSVGPPLPERLPFRPVIELVPPAGEATPPPRVIRPRYGLAALLFLATFFTTTTLGPVTYLMSRTDMVTDFVSFLSPQLVSTVWGNPAILRIGLTFSLTALFILLCHELGHYIACRRYGIPCT